MAGVHCLFTLSLLSPRKFSNRKELYCTGLKEFVLLESAEKDVFRSTCRATQCLISTIAASVQPNKELLGPTTSSSITQRLTDSENRVAAPDRFITSDDDADRHAQLYQASKSSYDAQVSGGYTNSPEGKREFVGFNHLYLPPTHTRTPLAPAIKSGPHICSTAGVACSLCVDIPLTSSLHATYLGVRELHGAVESCMHLPEIQLSSGLQSESKSRGFWKPEEPTCSLLTAENVWDNNECENQNTHGQADGKSNTQKRSCTCVDDNFLCSPSTSSFGFPCAVRNDPKHKTLKQGIIWKSFDHGAFLASGDMDFLARQDYIFRLSAPQDCLRLLKCGTSDLLMESLNEHLMVYSHIVYQLYGERHNLALAQLAIASSSSARRFSWKEICLGMIVIAKRVELHKIHIKFYSNAYSTYVFRGKNWFSIHISPEREFLGFVPVSHGYNKTINNSLAPAFLSCSDMVEDAFLANTDSSSILISDFEGLSIMCPALIGLSSIGSMQKNNFSLSSDSYLASKELDNLAKADVGTATNYGIGSVQEIIEEALVLSKHDSVVRDILQFIQATQSMQLPSPLIYSDSTSKYLSLVDWIVGNFLEGNEASSMLISDDFMDILTSSAVCPAPQLLGVLKSAQLSLFVSLEVSNYSQLHPPELHGRGDGIVLIKEGSFLEKNDPEEIMESSSMLFDCISNKQHNLRVIKISQSGELPFTRVEKVSTLGFALTNKSVSDRPLEKMQPSSSMTSVFVGDSSISERCSVDKDDRVLDWRQLHHSRFSMTSNGSALMQNVLLENRACGVAVNAQYGLLSCPRFANLRFASEDPFQEVRTPMHYSELHELQSKKKLEQFAEGFMLRRHIMWQQRRAEKAPPFPPGDKTRSICKFQAFGESYMQDARSSPYKQHSMQASMKNCGETQSTLLPCKPCNAAANSVGMSCLPGSDVAIDILGLIEYINNHCDSKETNTSTKDASNPVKVPCMTLTGSRLVPNFNAVILTIIAFVLFTKSLLEDGLAWVETQAQSEEGD